jgi:serine/threonine protein kinase
MSRPHLHTPFSPSQAVIRIYSEQVVQGLVYLHERGIIHRDIKGSNLLLVRHPLRMEVKLADFGCSVQTLVDGDGGGDGQRENRQRNTCAGTIQWMAPEVMKEEFYDHKADIWSFAMTVLEMATGEPPW